MRHLLLLALFILGATPSHLRAQDLTQDLAQDLNVCGWPASDHVSIADIDGKRTASNQAPSAVLLTMIQSDKTAPQYCGGTLLGSDWIITARHCVDGKRWTLFQATAGSAVVGGSFGATRSVEAAICPTMPNGKGFLADLALLRLKTPMPSDIVAATRATTADVQKPMYDRVAYSWPVRGKAPRNLALVERPLDVRRYKEGLVGARPLDTSQIGPCGGESGSGVYINTAAGLKLTGLITAVINMKRQGAATPDPCDTPSGGVLYTALPPWSLWIKETLLLCNTDPAQCQAPLGSN